MKKSIIVLMIVAFTVAGIGVVTPVETNAQCLICCASCGVGYAICMSLSDNKEFDDFCKSSLNSCRRDCPCCDGCPLAQSTSDSAPESNADSGAE